MPLLPSNSHPQIRPLSPATGLTSLLLLEPVASSCGLDSLSSAPPSVPDQMPSASFIPLKPPSPKLMVSRGHLPVCILPDLFAPFGTAYSLLPDSLLFSSHQQLVLFLSVPNPSFQVSTQRSSISAFHLTTWIIQGSLFGPSQPHSLLGRPQPFCGFCYHRDSGDTQLILPF